MAGAICILLCTFSAFAYADPQLLLADCTTELNEQPTNHNPAYTGQLVEEPPITIDLNNIGGAWGALGEPKKALEYFKQALSIDKEVYGDRHPNVAIRLNNIGMAWDALGDSQRAKECFQQAHSIGVERNRQ